MKKALKWTALAVAIPILLIVLLAVLLYLPPVQNWAVKQVARVASEKTGMEITVERVNLEFPLNLGVEGLRVLQPNDSLPGQKDTVADVRKLVVNVQLWPLLKKQVEIDALDFTDLTFNTTHFVPEARVKGKVGNMHLASHGIDLKGQLLRVNEAQLADAKIDVQLSDTVPPDTTKSENFWKISVDQLNIDRSDVTVRMPNDTLQVAAHLGKVEAKEGFFDLYKGEYKVKRLDWNDGALAYDDRFAPKVKGLDYNHLNVRDIQLGIDSLSYSSPKLSLNVRSCSLKEQSGLEVTELKGGFAMDDKKFYLPDLKLRTPESSLDAHVVMDQNAFADQQPGKIHVTADGSLGKQDIMRFLGGMPTKFVRQWPNQPLTVKTVLSGNMNRIEFTGLNAKLPSAFNINAKGYVMNPMDPDKMVADLNLDAKTYNINFLTSLVDPKTLEGIRIPQGIGVKGKFKADGNRYRADFTATEGKGSVKGKADIDTKTMRYQTNMTVNNLQLRHFLPGYEMGAFTGDIDLKGQGTDFLSPKTNLQAKARIKKFQYGQYNLDGMNATAMVKNGRMKADIDSNNPLLKGQFTVDALTNKKNIKATIAADVLHADLYKLHLTDEPMTVTMCGHFDVATDMNDFYQVQGMASDITVRDSREVYHSCGG